MRAGSGWVLLAALSACAGSVAHTETATRVEAAPPPRSQDAAASEASAPAGSAAGEAQAGALAEPPSSQPPVAATGAVDAVTRASAGWVPRPSATPQLQASPAAGAAAPPSAARGAGLQAFDAGEISRPVLLAVLSQGVGRFLQKVRAEAHVVGGRFVGWRIVSVFAGQSAALQPGLQAGDTVMRVNGQSIERPEQFKNVWDSMATESELVLLVERGGKQSQLRYRIIEPR